ncbi:MAG TPA: NAD(P)H-hydrate dehydratase [Gemmatimonadaceae bacterium]|nr:NAD(P)H-hydrate dehydratase [Gemmatimonadaceae bacterium]
MSSVAVLSAAEAAAWDRATIDAGVPSRALMQRAGAAAAAEIARRYHDRLGGGVVVFAGAGNNGGDGWVVARALAAAGVSVRVVEVEEPRTDDARAERALALRVLGEHPPAGTETLIVDGVLGTGARGVPRGAAAEAIGRMNALGDGGAAVIALDVPSGLDATTGEAGLAVTADLTFTFGAVKRGHLVARDRCGAIVVLDIGLDGSAAGAAPLLIDSRWVRPRVPPIAADAHKGTRRRLAIVGGTMGMLGASVLAGRAALRSGIGMVRLVVTPEGLPHVQASAPEMLAQAWPDDDGDVGAAISDWADVVAIGPGLGRSSAARALVERVLRGWRGPVVLDADALNVFEGEAGALGALLAGRPALVTPHPAECARLTGTDVATVLARRFEIGTELAREIGAAVLLKGVPTVIASASGERLVSAAGTPALAVAGSGDLLAGIAATLLGQAAGMAVAGGRAACAAEAGACAAWIHGRAAEIAGAGRLVRGVTLEHILQALSEAWMPPSELPIYPVLAELPVVGERWRSGEPS